MGSRFGTFQESYAQDLAIFRTKLEMEHLRADNAEAHAEQEKASADRAEEELARLRK